MRLRLPLLVAILAWAGPLHADAPWQKVDAKDGITVYRRDVAGSRVIAFKGEAVIAAPITRVASTIFDASRATEWIDGLADARVLRRVSDFEYVEYDHFKAPFVVSDRDFVTSNQLSWDAEHRSITIRIHSIADSAAPTTSYVRGTIVSSTFVLTPTADGKGTLVSGDVHCDLNGSLPAFVVNFVQEDWPRTTLTNLRTQVAKPNIVELPALQKH